MCNGIKYHSLSDISHLYILRYLLHIVQSCHIAHCTELPYCTLYRASNLHKCGCSGSNLDIYVYRNTSCYANKLCISRLICRWWIDRIRIICWFGLKIIIFVVYLILNTYQTHHFGSITMVSCMLMLDWLILWPSPLVQPISPGDQIKLELLLF